MLKVNLGYTIRSWLVSSKTKKKKKKQDILSPLPAGPSFLPGLSPPCRLSLFISDLQSPCLPWVPSISVIHRIASVQIYPPYSNNLIIWFLTRLNSLRQRVSSRHGLCSLGLTQLCWSFLSSVHSAWILSSILHRSALLRPLELRAHTTRSLARQCYPGYLTHRFFNINRSETEVSHPHSFLATSQFICCQDRNP